jgi:hypothetical protein
MQRLLPPRNIPQFVMVGLIVLLVALLIRPPPMSAPTTAPLPLDRKRYIAHWEEQLRATLNDPESAKFRDESVSLRGQKPVVCGEVNARNERGGYDGFRHFVAGPGFIVIAGVHDAGVVAKHWQELCAPEDASKGKASK